MTSPSDALDERLNTLLADAPDAVGVQTTLDELRSDALARLQELSNRFVAGKIAAADYAAAASDDVQRTLRVAGACLPLKQRLSPAEEEEAFGVGASTAFNLMYEARTATHGAAWFLVNGDALRPLEYAFEHGNAFARAASLWGQARISESPRPVLSTVDAEHALGLGAEPDPSPPVRVQACAALARNSSVLKSLRWFGIRPELDWPIQRVLFTLKAVMDTDASRSVQGAAAQATAYVLLRAPDRKLFESAVPVVVRATCEQLLDQTVLRDTLFIFYALDAQALAKVRPSGEVPPIFTVTQARQTIVKVVEQIIEAAVWSVAIEVFREGSKVWFDEMTAMHQKLNEEQVEGLRLVQERANIERIEREMREHFARDIRETADGRSDLARPDHEVERNRYC